MQPTAQQRRLRALTAVSLSVALACAPLACSSASQRARTAAHQSSDSVRYRLQLRANPVDPGQAFRCYGSCQSESSPEGYINCLAECPGFEVTPGEQCEKYEVPPVAACFTVRSVPESEEPPPGTVVVGVIAGFLLVVGAAVLCSSSSSQCYTPAAYPPYYR